MKIAVVGIGYVGLSNAILLSQKNEVVALDISLEKVQMLQQGKSPIADADIDNYLKTKKLNLQATTNKHQAISGADYVIIATPTNYDPSQNYFNTETVEATVKEALEIQPNTTIIIKSTVPVGYTNELKNRFNNTNIIFSPEFLREGKALYDNLYPSRIIVGSKSEQAKKFAEALSEGAIKSNIPILHIDSNEAEAIKLFSNTYLAMRVAFFNELDTYAEVKGLDSKQIIEGVCLDPRIGENYNNPSFGYGGYCLPKDTKQLLANFNDVPNNIISAIVAANNTRKSHIANSITKHDPEFVGIYRLTMKKDSDNFRESSIQGVMEELIKNEIKLVIYEPNLKEDIFLESEVITNLEDFKKKSNIIVANRLSKEIEDVSYKVYTRDLFSKD